MRMGHLVKFVVLALRTVTTMRLIVQVVETFALIVEPLRDFRFGKIVAVKNLSAQRAFNLSRIGLDVGSPADDTSRQSKSIDDEVLV